MSERAIQAAVMLACGSLPGVRLFRNNTGMAWQGDRDDCSTPRRLILNNPRIVHFGLCEGSSDLIGWDSVGRFLALEVKTATGQLTANQRRFIERVNGGGGLAGVVRSIADAFRVIGTEDG